MNELDTALYTLLNNDTTLSTLGITGIYRSIAKAGAIPPYIIFTPNESQDFYTLGGSRSHQQLHYRIEAVDATQSALRAGSIAARLDALLTNGTLSVAGFTLTTRRLSTYTQIESRYGTMAHIAGVSVAFVII